MEMPHRPGPWLDAAAQKHHSFQRAVKDDGRMGGGRAIPSFILGLVETAGAAGTDRQALPGGEEVAVAAFPGNTSALISSSSWKYMSPLPFGGQIHY